MTFEQLITLTSAGFTKADIMALAQTPAPAPAPATAPAPAPATGFMPQPVQATGVTPVQTVAGQTAPVIQGFGNPINPSQGVQEQFYADAMEQNGQQMQLDMGNGGVVKNNDPLIETINNLTRAVQANGIANSQMPTQAQPTVDDMLAEIIRPTGGQNGGR